MYRYMYTEVGYTLHGNFSQPVTCAMQNGKMASASTHLNAGWEEDPPAILSDQINHG